MTTPTLDEDTDTVENEADEVNDVIQDGNGSGEN